MMSTQTTPSSRGKTRRKPEESRKKNGEKQQKIRGSFRSLLLFYIFPFIILNTLIFFAVTTIPKIELAIEDTVDYKTVNFTIKKHTLFPLRSLTATLENEPITLKKGRDQSYSAEVTKNGTLEIVAVSINGMSTTIYDYIGNIDDAPPVIYAEFGEEDTVTVSFEDTLSGIDYNSLYAIDSKGKKIDPLSIDRTQDSVVFKFESNSLEVHVLDNVGNQALATFNQTVEGEENSPFSDNLSETSSENSSETASEIGGT